MNPERWRQMESLFQMALRRQPTKRASYLEEVCAGDAELRRELKALLDGHDETFFLDRGAMTAGLRAVEMRTALQAGQHLGPYEIETHIASGGMGMVYRARDTRLQRPVAIKVLRLSDDEKKLRARLQLEAQAIAKLQHPHICALHDVGAAGERDYLVMEYLAGETLAERLKRGPIPIGLALEYATQIAAALDQAHRRNIIHQDLKPGNVMITKTGTKLLDFGLAALHRPCESLADKTFAGEDLAATTWLTFAQGLAGTLPYMAPEQVRGESTDARTDIFAFGLLLYEMLSGRRAFAQKERGALASEILNDTPAPIPQIPAALERLLNTCLRKEPDERWQSAADLRRELAWIAAGEGKQPLAKRWNPLRVAGAVAAVFLFATCAVWAGYHMRKLPVPQTIRFSLPPPNGANFLSRVELAISPDGSQVAFTAETPDGNRALWVRSFSNFVVRLIPGSDGARAPFWSPDSRYIAFFASDRLQNVEASSGSVQIVCFAPTGRYIPTRTDRLGGTWGVDGTILFVPAPFTDLHRVSGRGGQSAVVRSRYNSEELSTYAWPTFLPDGRHFLFSAWSTRPGGRLYVGSLDSGEIKPLPSVATRVRYLSGHLYLGIWGGVLAQTFDMKHLNLTGKPTYFQGDIHAETGFDMSQTGALVYRPGSVEDQRELVWVDRSGKPVANPIGKSILNAVRVSPDGETIASVNSVQRSAPKIFVFKPPQSMDTSLDLHSRVESFPVWSPDGQRLAYASEAGNTNIFVTPRYAPAQEELLLSSDTYKQPRSWSKDGQYLSYSEFASERFKIWIIPLFGSRKPFQFSKEHYSISTGEFSPDGKWMAYSSEGPGNPEIFVARFPDGSLRRQLSIDGGKSPQWRKDGKELFYINGQKKLTAIPVSPRGATLEFGKPVPLFNVASSAGGDPYSTIDGERFLTISDLAATTSRPIIVVLNGAPSK